MKRAVLILLAVPVAVVLLDAARVHVRYRTNGSLISSGVERTYLLHVPRSYDGSKPAPLVISMHGGGGWPGQQRDLTHWNRLADQHGFLVVYPAGSGRVGPRSWGVSRGPRLGRDVRFISDLIDELQAKYNIDRERIYADGLSNGGGMAFVLSCALDDRIAAVGMVAAAQSLPWSWCTSDRAVPMITFHGTADSMIPYEGGATWVGPLRFPKLTTWTENWARRNRCAPEPIDSNVAADVIRREYTNCAEDASVVLYTIRGGGHSWPGGKPLPEWFVGPTTRSIDATSEMWEFFKTRKLRRAVAVSAQP